jgi:ribose transport system substrate-binding protein
VPEKPDDIEQQRALIERAIAERPAAAVFVPVHQTAVNDSILKLDAAGIPIISMISPTTVGRRVSFVYSDDRALASAITRHLAKRLNGRGSVIVLRGIPASGTTRARQLGIEEGLADFPGIEVVACVRGDYQQDVACSAVQAVMRKGARFDAVIAANDTMALGALDALRGRDPLPPIVGVNALPDAIDAIKRGWLYATVDFDAMKMACIATEAAIRHLRGELVRPMICLPVQVVDASNLAPWDMPYASRGLPCWDDVMKSQP